MFFYRNCDIEFIGMPSGVCRQVKIGGSMSQMTDEPVRAVLVREEDFFLSHEVCRNVSEVSQVEMSIQVAFAANWEAGTCSSV